ncbi:hypothetical protein [Rufibacter psychrotolerans]|uniref:hypothetical protein n=1 Tax=Rufibacter psychrotolerans TaxID=2812556 RepID=UPI001967F376|nr:hypothetical protein [Rufibacter sp. SYSU D00308]
MQKITPLPRTGCLSRILVFLWVNPLRGVPAFFNANGGTASTGVTLGHLGFPERPAVLARQKLVLHPVSTGWWDYAL